VEAPVEETLLAEAAFEDEDEGWIIDDD